MHNQERFEHTVDCPYCGERLSVLIDPQDAGQQYTEDCQVCCRPIVFTVIEAFTGELSVTVNAENETY